jgi:site-specific DNA-cytosine methylase
MQVARNFFLTNRQEFTRKFNEILLAFRIEEELSKQEILSLYANKIYMGKKAYGIGAAAQVYYGKRLSELSLAEIATIAGLPKAPSRYNPLANLERTMVRRNWILGRMLSLGKIDQLAYEDAAAEVDSASYHGSISEIDASYVAEMVRQEVVAKFGLKAYTEGYTAITTLDSALQAHAVTAVQRGIIAYDKRHGYRGAEQLGLDEVLSGLAAEGYSTRTFNIPACAVGAPHIRQRLFIISHSDSESEPDKPFDDGAGSGQLGFGFGGSEAPSHGANPNDHGSHRATEHEPDAQHGEAQLRDKQVRELGQVGQDVADTDNADRRRGTERRQVGDGELELHGEERPAKDVADTKRPRTGVEAHRGGRQERESPNTPKPKILPQGNGPGSPERASASGNDGARRPKDYWQSEPAVGRLADGIPNRVSQLRALGNTIIPQIAEEIGHAIVAATKG